MTTVNPIVWKIADAVLNLVAIGFEREAIMTEIAKKQAEGMTPDQIVTYLRDMRDAAMMESQAKIDRLPG